MEVETPRETKTTKARKQKRRLNKEYFWGYLFIAPPIIGFAIFALGPMLYSIYVSFTDFDLYNEPVWTGADNYYRLFVTDDLFRKTVFNTFYAALGIPIGMAVSLGIAVALNQKVKGIALFRTAFFLPAVSSVVAITLLWRWIFNADFGLLNIMLNYVGIHGPGWLSDEKWAMPAMIIQGVWGGLGINMILYLAALQGVNPALYEAADIDGGNAWQKFIHITVPSISPTTFFILITSTIGALQDFQRFMIMTEGGPNYSTTTVVYYLFLNAFRYMEMGYASAMAWVLGIIILIITIINFKLAKKWVHY
ncbi:sugar ABC transporter permease [Halalkalibacterium halodurans]|nr:sugar ABC transporter permease [Halalkalibacterium halodurans]MDY7222424.1 sugar ABC transporter permease [Halalkalibacterium halodurans]MDY7241645.1 sugar ABC transporter permease [Halalkalibacterium halodurans]MED4082268.1 sugar ABC transporter permease [Halalkalibacterium halodurans]MED4083581.1 sugar ABC transporter permease [Halalkalibacterium halodurans]MED4105894.1 sugar ABC transporter permease [Halalkalibacterium halodurans]